MELPRPVVYIKILSPITVGLSSVMGDIFHFIGKTACGALLN